MLTASALLAGPAFAVTAGKGDLKAPVSKPMSAWLVGPSQASAFDAKDHPEDAGCLMVTEFDNGMIVGFHARKEGVIGMTVDTKQQTMAAGDPRNVGLNLGQDAYVINAVASDSSTISLPFNDAGGGQAVVERLTALGNFRILLDEKPYYFATTGFTDGLARLQACMGSTMAVPVVVRGPGETSGKVVHDTAIESMLVTSSGHETPLALAMPNLIPAGYRFVLEDVDPMTLINWQSGGEWVDTMRNALIEKDLKMTIAGKTIRIEQRIGTDDPVVDKTQATIDEETASMAMADVPEGVWGAAKGESLSSVLEAWGLMAGVNVKTDLTGNLTLPRDVKYEGRFDEAVQKLLAQFTGDAKPTAAYRGMIAGPVPEPVGYQKTTRTETKTEYVYKPEGENNFRTIDQLKAEKKKWAPAVSASTGPTKQMSTIPDPPNAPKTVSGKSETKKKTGKVKTSGTWSALEGTGLRDVLEQWGDEAGVRVIWLTDQNYPMPETFKEKGKFEDVVLKALAQYEGQGVRPVAQLNKDPKTGEKALIIKNKRN